MPKDTLSILGLYRVSLVSWAVELVPWSAWLFIWSFGFSACLNLLSHSFFLLCYKINFQRYESEYISHYKQFESRRPNTVKGEVTRSLSFNDHLSNGSTPRAGLLSTQLGSTLEPPLQRKRIVPYEKNHNIFTTLTVKEQHDRDWLKSDGNSHRSRSPNRQYKEVECLQYYYNNL